jgi:hypothetical protein
MNRLASQLRDPRVVGVIVALAVALAVGLGWVLAAGGGSGPGQVGAAATAPGTPTPDGSEPVATATPDQPGDQPPGSGDSDDPGGQSAPSEPAGPRIETFRVAQEPQCPGGTTANPIDGQPVMLEWLVTGTDQVSISIDGAGVYATYPADGGDTYSFGCEGSEGDIQRHTYLLTAVVDGRTVTETLVVTATVHERTEV